MKKSQKPQSIIISGESGAGKTETSKLFSKFLCKTDSAQFSHKIIESNVLLESFGNSQTPANANSSRFVKVIQVYFFGSILEL